MLKFIIKGQEIKRADTHRLVQYAQEYPTAEFTFDPDWNGLEKTVQWNMAEENYDTPIKDGYAVVPWELLRNRGVLNVNVVGVDESKVITTNTVSIDVMGCGVVGAMVSGSPSESYYGILEEKVADAEGAIDEVDQKTEANKDQIEENILATEANRAEIEAIKNQGKLDALEVDGMAVLNGEIKVKDGIKIESLNVENIYGEERPRHQIDISDKSGIRILSKGAENDSKRYIRIGELVENTDDISYGIQYENENGEADFYVGASDRPHSSVSDYLIRLSEDDGPLNLIRGNKGLKILSGVNGQDGVISFDTEDAGIKYTRGTWTEILKQLDVILTKGVNMEAKNNSYWWVNEEKKAQYGNSLNKLEFRTDGVAKFSNIVNASDYQIGGTPVLDMAEETAESLARNAAFAMTAEVYDDTAANKDVLLNYLLDGNLSTATSTQIGDNVYALSTDKTVVIRGSGATYNYTEPITGTSYSWTADDLTLSDTLTENPVLGTIFSYTAGSNSAVTANSKTFSDGKTFNQRLQYKGSATVGSSGSFTVNAPSPGKLTVYFVTGSNAQERTIRLFNGNSFEVLGSVSSGPVVSGYVYNAAIFDIPKAGTYYIACRDGAVNYYGMTFTQATLFSGKMVYVLNGITKLGDYLFAETQLDKVYAPYSVTTLGSHTFYGTKCDNITLKGITTFNGANSETFRYADIGKLTFEKSVTALAENDFGNTNIEEINIKANGITGAAFANANVGGKIVIDTDGDVLSFGNGTFGEIEIIANTIRPYAFSNNSAVFPYFTADKVKITVQSILQNAFYRNKISNMYICTSNISSKALADAVFEDVVIDGANVLSVYTLMNSEADKITFKNAYSLDFGLGSIYNAAIPEIILCEGITSFSTFTFAYNKELKEIEIPSTVVEAEWNIFSGCTNLKKITVNKPVNSLSGAPWGAPNATIIWTG